MRKGGGLPALKPCNSFTRSQPSQYKIERAIGHGHYAKVFECIKINTGQQYAMKVFPISNLKSEGSKRRFQSEIDTIAILKHDNIVKLHDFFADNLNFYLIMDFCQDGDLTDAIYERGRFSEPICAYIFHQIVSAVAYFHSYGVTHRDLKLENIFVDKFPHIKVGDFGLCRFIDPDSLMTTYCGSPCYCAPECLSKVKYDGKKADIWSLGVILYSLVVGESPWCTTSAAGMIKQIRSATIHLPEFVSSDCKDLISMILQLNPNQRPELQQILQHPWLQLGGDLPHLPQISCELPHPPLKMLSELSTHLESNQMHGIYSPFSDSDDEEPISLSSINKPDKKPVGISRSIGTFRLISHQQSPQPQSQAPKVSRWRKPYITKISKTCLALPTIRE